MAGVFEHYYTHLLDDYPDLLLEIVLVYVVLTIIYGILRNSHEALAFLLLGYVVLIIYVTVLSRQTNDHIKYCFWPFATYLEITKGDRFLLPQVIMNVVMFIPVGFLIKAVFKSRDLMIIGGGALLSILIELLQLVLLKGSSELDDVIHNTLGCILGYGVYSLSHDVKN